MTGTEYNSIIKICTRSTSESSGTQKTDDQPGSNTLPDRQVFLIQSPNLSGYDHTTARLSSTGSARFPKIARRVGGIEDVSTEVDGMDRDGVSSGSCLLLDIVIKGVVVGRRCILSPTKVEERWNTIPFHR